MYGNDLRRVKNLSTSQSRHDLLLRMTDTRKYRITSAKKFPIQTATTTPKN